MDFKPIHTNESLQKMQEENDQRRKEMETMEEMQWLKNSASKQHIKGLQISKSPTQKPPKIEITNSFASLANTHMDSVDDVASLREASQDENSEKRLGRRRS
ncbi:hypothetical protein JTB14_005201 [Gonioctena quinquepunctata]|nr:hypothetical protein JTB14_005201 [Gonioctena quinquepunctata]